MIFSPVIALILLMRLMRYSVDSTRKPPVIYPTFQSMALHTSTSARIDAGLRMAVGFSFGSCFGFVDKKQYLQSAIAQVQLIKIERSKYAVAGECFLYTSCASGSKNS